MPSDHHPIFSQYDCIRFPCFFYYNIQLLCCHIMFVKHMQMVTVDVIDIVTDFQFFQKESSTKSNTFHCSSSSTFTRMVSYSSLKSSSSLLTSSLYCTSPSSVFPAPDTSLREMTKRQTLDTIFERS